MKTNSKLLGMEGMRLRLLVRSRLEEKARLGEVDKVKQVEEKGEQATVQPASDAEDGKELEMEPPSSTHPSIPIS